MKMTPKRKMNKKIRQPQNWKMTQNWRLPPNMQMTSKIQLPSKINSNPKIKVSSKVKKTQKMKNPSKMKMTPKSNMALKTETMIANQFCPSLFDLCHSFLFHWKISIVGEYRGNSWFCLRKWLGLYAWKNTTKSYSTTHQKRIYRILPVREGETPSY